MSQRPHHIFCNRGRHSGPSETCSQCRDLYAKWTPAPGETMDAMVARVFPDVIIRPGT